MIDATELVRNYVAVWNEGDADERRRRIRAVWAPDGTICYRLLDAHGYDAIEARVAGSWEKWLRDGKYIFRPRAIACHHDVVKFDWEMIAVPSGAVEAAGLSFLVFDADGRIRHDYQFNPSAQDASELATRYLAIMREPSAAERRRAIAALWAADGILVTESAVMTGHDRIDADPVLPVEGGGRNGEIVATAASTQAHHNLVHVTWRLRHENGGRPIAASSDLLILDDSGRIRVDYRFHQRV